ncbi:MAG TPA: multidrug ABC transporter permease [Planctomycetes bacterium]|nr:multidrug ABC transporter permease [Planctomycetota bacterium]
MTNLSQVQGREASPWSAVTGLASREVVSFLRQRSRVIASLATPIMFWLMFGAGFGSSFRGAGAAESNFLEYFFPGILILAVVFAGIFSTISTIQDRQEGFLQSVLVAPIPRWAIVSGKILGGSLLAFLQGAVLLALGPLAGIPFHVLGFALALVWLFLISVGMTALGFYFAWKIDSVQGFHGVMNTLLMPMWLLSGAFFPAAGAYWVIKALMTINPLTYGLVGLRRALYMGTPEKLVGLPSSWVCLAVVLGMILLMIGASASAVRKKAL